MKFALNLSVAPAMNHEQAIQFMEIARMAESYGFGALGTGDTSLRLNDASVRVSLMALATTTARIGMKPTNPLTREPQVATSFFSTIDELTGGRAFVEIASGDSAVASVGYRSATRARIEEYVRCVRELLADGTSNYQGRPQNVLGAPRRPIRVAICAEGPKMLTLGGRIGDSVSAGMGLTPEVVADTKAIVEAGAKEAGRAPSDVDVWFTCRSAISLDRDEAINRSRGTVSSILHHSMSHGVEGRGVPEQHKAAIVEYVKGYAINDHYAAGGTNAVRMNDLGLTDYALARWGIAGDPSDWVRRIESLGTTGASQLWFTAFGSIERLKQTVSLIGEQVLPHFL